MQYDVEVSGRLRQVAVTRRDGRFVVVLDNLVWTIDGAQVGGHLLSLLIEREVRLKPDTTDEVRLKPDTTTEEAADPGVASGFSRTRAGAVESREIAIATDPVTGQFVFSVGTLALPVALNTRRRFGRKDDAGEGGSGPQRIVASMPGKVVRLLARQGDSVAPRQPVVVIEAMKMENEIRASRDGTVTDVLVQEGQSVEAGTLLAIITPS